MKILKAIYCYAILASSLTSCISTDMQARLLSAQKLSPDDFEGVFAPRSRMTPDQLQTFGTEIVISNFVPKDVFTHLLANPLAAEQATPSISIAISKEDERSDATGVGQARLYLLGINKGPIDLIHYEFDDDNNAFERTTTTLEGNLLTHHREMLLYRKNDPEQKTRSAGFGVTHSFQLFNENLVIVQEITKLDAPWTQVFPPSGNMHTGKIAATFLRVNDFKKQALGPYVPNWRF